MIPFEVLEHTADIGLRAYGNTLKEAFENAARGMFSLMVDPATVNASKKLVVRAEADDAESLLAAWLNELLYLFDSQYILMKDFDIKKWDEKSCLEAVAYGESIDLNKHQFELDIKACTYHKLQITRNKLWTCQVIFDV